MLDGSVLCRIRFKGSEDGKEKLLEHWEGRTNGKLIEVEGCGVWMGKKCRDENQHDLVAISVVSFDYGSKRMVE